MKFLLTLLLTISGCGDNLEYTFRSSSSGLDSDLGNQNGNNPDGGTNNPGSGDTDGEDGPTSVAIANISTSLADGFYKSGDILDITITMSEEVLVSEGSPTLVFNSDGVNQIQGEADYLRTENGTNLKFEYTFQNDDNYHLIQLKNFELNGASITGENGESAKLSLTPGDYSKFHKVSVDNVEDLIISFDEFNELDKSSVENPTMRVTGRDIVGFNYKIVGDLSDCSDGNGYISVGGMSTVVDLKAQQDGTKYVCAVGKINSGFTKPYANLKTNFEWVLDRQLATIVNVTSRYPEGLYGEGSSIEVLVEFSEPVITDTTLGSPTLRFRSEGSGPDDDKITGQATYNTRSWNRIQSFSYTFLDGDNSKALDVEKLILNGATIKDSAGNSIDPAIVPYTFSSNRDVVVDTRKPTIKNISTTNDQNLFYKNGEEITLKLKFSEIIYVDSLDKLKLNLKFDDIPTSSSGMVADRAKGSGSDTLTFTYTVDSKDQGMNLDVVSIELGVAEIKDQAGNDLDPAIPGGLFSGSYSINADNVDKVGLAFSGINPLNVSNLKSDTLTVNGSNMDGSPISSFKYKLSSSNNDCRLEQNYITVSSASTTIDFSSMTSDGLIILCALGIDSAGYVKPAANNPSMFAWFAKRNPPPPLKISGLPLTTPLDNHTVTVEDIFIGGFYYKYGLSGGIDCSKSNNYSTLQVVNTLLPSTRTFPVVFTNGEGSYTVCVYGKDKFGNEQDLSDAVLKQVIYSVGVTTAEVEGALESHYNASSVPGTMSNPISVRVNGYDGYYKYILAPSKDTDCLFDTAKYSAERLESVDIDGFIDPIVDQEYTLCLIGRDAAGTQTVPTEYAWTYDNTAPTITDIEVNSPKTSYYQNGENISLSVTFDEEIFVTGGTPSIDIETLSPKGSVGEADYQGAKAAKSLLFKYSVSSSDNGLNIFPNSLDTGIYSIEDLAGNSAILNIPPNSNFATAQLSIDNVAKITIQFVDFNEGDTINLDKSTMQITDPGIGGFEYKFVDLLGECETDTGYISMPSKSAEIDFTGLSDGDIIMCAIGIADTGFIKPYDSNPSTFRFMRDTLPPAAPINIENVKSITNLSDMQVTINDNDVAKYRYKFGLTATTDCKTELNYGAEIDKTDGKIDLIMLTEGEYSLCVIGADAVGNWQNVSNSTTHRTLYKNTPPAISDVDSYDSNKYYDVGEKINILVTFSESVKIESGTPELVLKSSSSSFHLGNAIYKSGSDSFDIIFEYTVASADFGLEIEVDTFFLNGATIKDIAGNNADLTIAASNSLATSKKISVDTLEEVQISFDEFLEGETTGLAEATLNITASSVTSYEYKVTNSMNECQNASGYTDRGSLAPVLVTLSGLSLGPAYACAVGVNAAGFTKPYTSATIFTWERDTKCGEVNGDGSLSNPYEVKTEAHLQLIASNSLCFQSYYEQKNDISITASNWTTIGNYTEPFTGSYDGGGYSISHLRIISNAARVGLFGKVVNGKIANVNLKDIVVQGGERVGGLAGEIVNTLIDSATVETGVVTGKTVVAGLIGFSDQSQIYDSHADVDVSAEDHSAGLVGVLRNGSKLQKSYSKGHVYASNLSSLAAVHTGGLVGLVDSASSIEASFSTGIVKVTKGDNVGGLVGTLAQGSNIETSFATGDVNGVGGAYGGLVGAVQGQGSVAQLSFSYSLGNVKNNGENTGSFIGVIEDANVNDCYSQGFAYPVLSSDGNSNAVASFIARLNGQNVNVTNSYAIKYSQDTFYQSNSKLYPDTGANTIEVEAIAPDDFKHESSFNHFATWDFSGVWTIDPHLNRPVLQDNTEDERAYIAIYDHTDFYAIRNDLRAYYLMMNDIDLSSYTGDGWEPIGTSGEPTNGEYLTAFQGRLDGGGNKIKNLFINRSGEKHIGLFGATDGASIVSVDMENYQITCNKYCGSLVGFTLTPSSLLSVSASGSVSGRERVGGIIGQLNGGIFFSDIDAQVIASVVNAGGIIGFGGQNKDGAMSYVLINNSETSDTSVIQSVDTSGGIAGRIEGPFAVISDTTSRANIQSINLSASDSNNFGGILGQTRSDYILIEKSHYINTGKGIEGNYSLGGILGKSDRGGNLKLSRCSVNANISIGPNPKDSGAFTGGLIGRNLDMESVDISESWASVNITQPSYSSGVTDDIGGLIGELAGTVTSFRLINSYATGSISLVSTSYSCSGLAGGVGADGSTTERTMRNLYSNMDLSNNCYVSSSSKLSLFGFPDGGDSNLSSGIERAINDGTYQNIFGYNDNFTYEQCVKTNSTDLQVCSIHRGYTDELNALSADTWEEDLSCELKFVPGKYQPTLKNNPHTVTCFK